MFYIRLHSNHLDVVNTPPMKVIISPVLSPVWLSLKDV